MSEQEIQTQCCISGGGPAGIMLGFLLARAGVDVVVLEKWPDFFRDFRGDTIHPSTMEMLYELGILEDFLKLKHNETREIDAYISRKRVIIADFTHLKTHAKFLAFIPQWDFLNFIAAHAKKYPSFHLLMKTEATDLIIEENEKIAGVHARSPKGQLKIKADLVIGADGRHSTIREKSGLTSTAFGAPMDVLWFRISRERSDDATSLGRVDRGQIVVMIDRDEYWQCAMVIKKGQFEKVKMAGLDAFHKNVADMIGFGTGRMQEIKTWDDVKFLGVTVDRLDTWYRPGLLCIGDAAHAMSPIGGIGINLAVQDAVATANILAPKFKNGVPSLQDLAAVQTRRDPPTRKTQKLQLFIQDHLIEKVLNSNDQKHYSVPWQIKMLQWFPILRRIPARIVGIGFQPEHIEN